MQQDITVREVMDDTYVGVSESDDLLETVELLLSDGAPVAVVLQGRSVVGVCADRDVLELLAGGVDLTDVTVGDAMTDAVYTIRPDRSLAEARDRMTSRATGWLVVTAGTEPLGVVTEHDLLAGSALGGETTTGTTERTEGTVAVVESSATTTTSQTATDDAFEEQGICEVCGTLTHNLTAFNGQLRCADCRNV